MEPIIQIENISKMYRLGVIGTGTISHDLNRWWHKVRGKEDPYLKIGETNIGNEKSTSEYVWAIKDINLEVSRGEVMGIIGKNGAGKSTLLKILSKVTGPTTGNIKYNGRIGSLLEVGTGFHPELTGRENIFLNGAILGMSKQEIRNKLDEIIEFAGMARYVDTPVKRYSSGMKVRLGFAVAAHLEPEILVVDEVLAVGDAEFQKKAIGKMQDVSKKDGRTILFVSHNMASVASLCTKGVVLENGMVKFIGEVDNAVSIYFKGDNKSEDLNIKKWITGNEPNVRGVKLIGAGVYTKGNKHSDPIKMDMDVIMECELEIDDPGRLIYTNWQFIDETGRVLFVTNSKGAKLFETIDITGNNRVMLTGTIPKNFFNEGDFTVNIRIVEEGDKAGFIMENNVLRFHVNPKTIELGSWMGKSQGSLKPEFEWLKKQL